MEIDNLLFYAQKSKLLNNYKKINKKDLDKLIDTYKIEKKPDNFEIEKRENNFFVHKIEKIKEDYIKQQPYKLIENEETLYKTSSKNNGLRKLDENNIMYEKDLCKEIWFASYNEKANYPFDIIDIQTPLKPRRNLKYGEIDIVGVDIDKDNNVIIYLIEAKPLSTKETLLRAVVEAITYRYIIEENRERFINDFKNYIKKYEGKGIKANKVKTKILNNENIKIKTKTLILVPKRLYEDNQYSKIIYNNYKSKIDFYYVEYNKEDLEFHTKEERKETVFKKGKKPLIKKYEE